MTRNAFHVACETLENDGRNDEQNPFYAVTWCKTCSTCERFKSLWISVSPNYHAKHFRSSWVSQFPRRIICLSFRDERGKGGRPWNKTIQNYTSEKYNNIVFFLHRVLPNRKRWNEIVRNDNERRTILNIRKKRTCINRWGKKESRILWKRNVTSTLF